MSVTDRLYDSLVNNREALTAKQIAARYNVSNPYNPVYELRNEGVKIALRDTTNSKGRTTKKYRFVG